MRFLILSLLLCFGLQTTFAQNSVEQKMAWYALAKPTSNLFVHFDKNVYSNNETVWFAGYLLTNGRVPITQHKIMAVALVRNIDSNIIATHKFSIQNGFSFGDFSLPDSIQTGDYHFLVYTDQLVNGIPEAIFTQQITLKTNIDPPFKANMKLIETPSSKDKIQQVLVSVTTNDNRFLPKPININFKYGELIQKAKTNSFGEYLINLPIQKNFSDPNLYVKLIGQKDSSFLSMALPILKNKASVKFYPESGNAILGISTTIGFEVKDQQKKPIASKALLYKNNKVIDTVETSSYGLGKFKLLFEKGANYSLKLVHNGVVDSIYQLPKPLENGFVVNIEKAVVQDTVRLQLKTNGIRKIFIRLHNFTESFLYAPFEMENDYRLIKIPLTDIPKGLFAVTITDSLDRPLAERIIFAHYDAKEKLAITTNKQIYHQREKIDLKLNLLDDKAQGVVSIAVVQDNRIAIKNMNDIESYAYLKSSLVDLPTHLFGSPYKDSAYLEQVLLIKGWRRYNWEELQQAKATDTISKIDSLTFTAQVTKGNKAIYKSISISAFGDSQLRIANTSSSGFINLNIPDFMSNEKKKLYLFINDKNKVLYDIKLHDEFKSMSEHLKKLNLADDIILPSSLPNNSILLLQENEKSIRLKEVVIKSKKENVSLNGRIGANGSNPCGDYVCLYRIFNCPNHMGDFRNTQPIKGQVYAGLVGPYAGCSIYDKDDHGFVQFDGIHYGKEFYISDYKDPNEPAFFSTIYWNNGTLLTSKKETKLGFYTSDITGKFRVVIQGVTNKDVIYAEHFFEVNK